MKAIYVRLESCRMRKIVVFVCLLTCGVVFAGMEDAVLRFSTSGTDRYADGSVVVDDECYALVWSPAGTVFSGFNADGTAISANDRVVLAAPLAKDGKCRDAFFQVPAAEYAELADGEWAVCLVDTRNVYGIPAGVQDGRPLRVNRWGLVQSGVQVEEVSKMTAVTSVPGKKLLAATGRTRSSASATSGVRANVLSAVPDSVKDNPPQITDIDVSEGVVRLTVSDTVPFLSYTIVSGSEPNNLKTDYFSEVIDGENGGEIAIGTVQSPTRRFFKVKRAE